MQIPFCKSWGWPFLNATPIPLTWLPHTQSAFLDTLACSLRCNFFLTHYLDWGRVWFLPLPLSLDDVDNGTGLRPFNYYSNRACMGSFGNNKIDFSSPSVGFGVGCSGTERRNFLWAFLCITIAIEMEVKGANHVLVGLLSHLSLGLRLSNRERRRSDVSRYLGDIRKFLFPSSN